MMLVVLACFVGKKEMGETRGLLRLKKVGGNIVQLLQLLLVLVLVLLLLLLLFASLRLNCSSKN